MSCSIACLGLFIHGDGDALTFVKEASAQAHCWLTALSMPTGSGVSRSKGIEAVISLKSIKG